MTGINWHDPQHRRDIAIVVGLFALGAVLNLLVGLLVLGLLEALGLWDLLEPLELELAGYGPTGHASGVGLVPLLHHHTLPRWSSSSV